MAGIPVIDLRKFEAEPEKLREASKKWGCFRVVNHGVPTKLMAEMKQVAKDLHDLPLEIKLRNIDGKLPFSGYTASSGNKPIYEALGLFDSTSSHSISTFCAQLEASPLQRETIQKYFKAIYEVAIDVASKLARSMGLVDYCFDSWPCQFKINKYSPTKENVGSSALRIHTDSGFLNVLHDDENIGGLQVMDQHGTFVDVDPLPGSLFVNFGDMVVPWSNGRLPSVVHRVQCKGVGLRYTIATSILPPPEQILEAPSEFIDTDHPRLYTSFTYEEYRKLRASKDMHAGEALEVILRAEN